MLSNNVLSFYGWLNTRRVCSCIPRDLPNAYTDVRPHTEMGSKWSLRKLRTTLKMDGDLQHSNLPAAVSSNQSAFVVNTAPQELSSTLQLRNIPVTLLVVVRFTLADTSRRNTVHSTRKSHAGITRRQLGNSR